jgi:glutamine synthetase
VGDRKEAEAQGRAARGRRRESGEDPAPAAQPDARDRKPERSRPVRELFGETFVDHFVRTREWEWRQFQDAVTDWETKRYFEII